jgi:type VI secretion system secreted protein VgrG
MPTWSRDTSLLTVTSPLGQDALIPYELSAREQVSAPFLFEIRAFSQQGIFDPDKLLNQSACVKLQQKDGSGVVRYFQGIVQSVVAEGGLTETRGANLQAYRVTLVPKLWFLGQTVDCRVFQNKTTVDILTQMFNDAGLTDVTYPPAGATREYTVQFNESDLHFATRLMEEEGYYYFFQHSDSKHQLIIANANTAFTDVPDASEMHFGGGDSQGGRIFDWERTAATTRGKMTFKDYDPTKATTELKNDQPTTLKTGGATQRDDFRWPALSFDNGTITQRTKHEMEAAEAAVSIYSGASKYGPMYAGGKFTIANKQSNPYDATYVLQSVTHHATDDTWLTGGGTPSYENHFTCFPSKVTWRQPLVTPRPRMDGIHTAVVLGPNGEEIYTDDLARVKVRFFWDHRSEATDALDVWARVIMPWAGNGWGAQFIPRVGTEVAVAFVDGDPDRPIVVGGLYNSNMSPIYSSSDKTKSGFRTRSSLKGGTSDFNEYTFDDKKGNELIYEQAQKDLKTYVKNDQTLTIDNCRMVTVKKDETVDIQNNQKITVKQDHSLTVTQGNRAIDVQQGNNSLKVDMGNHDVKVAMGNHTTDVQMGNVSLKADLGQITNEAMQSIELKVGANSIKIDQMGVTITGMMVKIQGQVQTQIQGLMTQVNADAMLQIQGAITMIN